MRERSTAKAVLRCTLPASHRPEGHRCGNSPAPASRRRAGYRVPAPVCTIHARTRRSRHACRIATCPCRGWGPAGASGTTAVRRQRHCAKGGQEWRVGMTCFNWYGSVGAGQARSSVSMSRSAPSDWTATMTCPGCALRSHMGKRSTAGSGAEGAERGWGEGEAVALVDGKQQKTRPEPGFRCCLGASLRQP